MSDKKTNFRFIFGIFMVLAYLGISYLVVFTPVLIQQSGAGTLPNDENFIVRIVLGIVLLAYGLFRGYRIWKINQ